MSWEYPYDDDDEDEPIRACSYCGYGCSGVDGMRNFCSSECYEYWQEEFGDTWG